MKKTFLIFTILILLTGYIVFIHKYSEFVAGEYRYYTLFEKVKSKEKYFDYSANAYVIDSYNLKLVKNRLISEIEKLDKFKKKLAEYNNSINTKNNSLSDYNLYISKIKNLKINFVNQLKIINNFNNDLNELESYINKFERDLLSIKMYKSEILDIKSTIKSIDSSKTDYFRSVIISQYIAATKGLALMEKIKKEKEAEQERLITQIDRVKDFEIDNQHNSTFTNYSTNNYKSYNLNNQNFNRYDLPNSYYTTPSISSYPSTDYSTSTNPNIIKIDGYYRSNGTYVEPHIRTAPNRTVKDNFSFYGNLNPSTGQIGTKR